MGNTTKKQSVQRGPKNKPNNLAKTPEAKRRQLEGLRQKGLSNLYWTEERAEEATKRLAEIVDEDEEILFWRPALKKLEEENEDGRSILWDHVEQWEKKYTDNSTIQRTIKRIRSTLEQRAANGAIRNKLNPTFTIFHLKNNYGWKDRQEHDVRSAEFKLYMEDKKDEEDGE